jgi:type IX secretion system PorP/SprF family membrane protein
MQLLSMKYVFLFLCSLLVLRAHAQQYPVFTQYYFNELVINPAYAGSHVQLSASSSYRNQWVNFPGAPKTISFSGHSSFFKSRMGLGLLINRDEIGSYKNNNVYAMYSYNVKFANATLAAGIQAGTNLLGADFRNLDLSDPTDPSFNVLIREFKPNFGAGLYYNRKNFFVGFSVPFILNNSVATSFEGFLSEIKERRYYYIRSGYIHTVNKDVKLNPSILLRTQEGQALSLDVNTAVIFYDALSVGLSLRTNDSFITFIDLKLSEKFHFAYSYDWTQSTLATFSNGTHEFMLNYRQRINVIHKDLQCPQFYDYR